MQSARPVIGLPFQRSRLRSPEANPILTCAPASELFIPSGAGFFVAICRPERPTGAGYAATHVARGHAKSLGGDNVDPRDVRSSAGVDRKSSEYSQTDAIDPKLTRTAQFWDAQDRFFRRCGTV
jgi:hypothetical protein